MTHVRGRCTSKNFTFASHHVSSFSCNAASRLPLSSAYRFMNSRRASCFGSGGAFTSMPSMLRNHRSSLTHWWTICSCTLRPRRSPSRGRTGRSASWNSLQTLTTFTRSVAYVSTRNAYLIAANVTLIFRIQSMPRRLQPLRVAIDTGGTFTDCVWIDRDGRLRMLKVFSTPDDPSRAIVEALRKIEHTGEVILLHGTTVGTNTLLERKGARTALVTTAGFEDAIEIGRQARPKLYDFFFDCVEPLVPSDLRFGVEERTAGDGEILTAPSAANLKRLVSQVAAKRPESIAICLLFSFANPKNELEIEKSLESLGVPLSISHQILPEFREYERASTVVVNAYLEPVMRRYLEKLEGSLAAGTQRLKPDLPGLPYGTAEAVPFPSGLRIFVMQSSGGITSLAAATREPVRTVLSGPAGGVVGAAASSRASGFPRIIAFDMGGTSTDVSLVEGAKIGRASC